MLLLACTLSGAFAAPRPFEADSLETIEGARSDLPFVLLLWSLDCPPCMAELERVAGSSARIPDDRLVLVNTDGEADDAEIEAVAMRLELTRFEHWRFADPFVERLRYAIDPAWYGELPRAYLYPADDARVAHSGVLDDETLDQWLQRLDGGR